MNSSHSKLTDWGLAHVVTGKHEAGKHDAGKHGAVNHDARKRDTILDVGCGGGRTVSKLAAIATEGKVYGVDYSEDSVAASKRTNARWIGKGRIDNGQVEIRQGSVSQLAFSDGMFDLVTAVETHFFWPDLPGDVREIFRVVKPGGTLVLIAEIYGGSKTRAGQLAEKYLPQTGMKLLTVEEHRELLEGAGFSDVRVVEEVGKGWICAIGRRGF
jgi:SAM-dependent methyltransferase